MTLYMPIAEVALDVTLLLALGVSVGILSGMFGVGGGFIMTPALIFLGVPSLVAVGTGALQVIAASVSGAVRNWQQGNVDIKLGGLLIAGGLIGATSGVQIQRLLKSFGQLDLFISLNYVFVLGVIGTLMLIEGISTWRKAARTSGTPSRQRAGQHTLLQRLPLKMRFPRSRLYASAIPPFAVGMLVGWLTAIMGVGGGFLLVPALIYVIRIPTRMAIGTSAFQIIFVINLIHSRFKGAQATDNPWQGTSLEWATSSPPPWDNFGGRLPVVYHDPYQYGIQGVSGDFVMQNSSEQIQTARGDKKLI